jgi:nucleotide-binding universal stress UspA family protein
MRFRRIVVPLDGSDAASAALRHANGLARRCDGELLLLTVLDVRGYGSCMRPEGLEWRLRHDEALARLGAIAAASVSSRVRCDCTVLDGGPAERIHAFARERGADLIVFSTVGESGGSGFRLGGTALRLAALDDVSTLAVPPEHTDATPRYGTILVPLDGSRRAEQAVAAAISSAAPDARLLLLHVVETPGFRAAARIGTAERDLRDRIVACSESHARRYLNDVAARFHRHARIRSVIRRSTNVIRTIVAAAAEERADLVLMVEAQGAAANGRASDTARGVTESCRTPVLVLRRGVEQASARDASEAEEEARSRIDLHRAPVPIVDSR